MIPHPDWEWPRMGRSRLTVTSTGLAGLTCLAWTPDWRPGGLSWEVESVGSLLTVDMTSRRPSPRHRNLFQRSRCRPPSSGRSSDWTNNPKGELLCTLKAGRSSAWSHSYQMVVRGGRGQFSGPPDRRRWSQRHSAEPSLVVPVVNRNCAVGFLTFSTLLDCCPVPRLRFGDPVHLWLVVTICGDYE